MNPKIETAASVGYPSTEITTDSLGESPTDLAKLVKRVDQRRCGVVAVSGRAITRWNRDDPKSWERVRAWLTDGAVRIVET
jgi:hypothetical protein